MRILTIGDSWTYGAESSDPSTMSWPAQLSNKYQVEVTNLARPGISNQRATRIGIEELCRDSNYDYVIFPLGPASRTELLNKGKWQQLWPQTPHALIEKCYADMWLPWNDVQNTIMLCFYFMHSIKSLGIPLYVTGLSMRTSSYYKELEWITNYTNDNDFNRLGMPLSDLNIGIADLDRKLKSLRAIHTKNLQIQPEYLNDTLQDYFLDAEVGKKYGYVYNDLSKHPNDTGYAALADFFAKKIGLTTN